MAVSKKPVPAGKSSKPSPKAGGATVAATRISTTKIHTTSVDASGGFQ